MDKTAAPTEVYSKAAENPVKPASADTSAPHSEDKQIQSGRPSSPNRERHSSSRQSNYSPLISPLPANAIVFSSPERESFDRYIENEYGPVLKNRLSSDIVSQYATNPPAGEPSGSRQVQNKASGSSLRGPKEQGSAEEAEEEEEGTYATFWAALAKDFGDKHQPTGQNFSNLNDSEKRVQYGYEFNATRPEINSSSTPWWVADYDEDGFYSIGALLFIFGFFLPPLWWLGAVWPRRSRERGGKMADRWQKINKTMSIGFSIALILAIIIAVIVWKA